MKFNMQRFAFAVFVVFVLWGIFFLIALAVWCSGGGDNFGNMGDAFGILNTLFAGLAFAVICAQLWMQHLQIEEERDARYRADRIGALATRIQVTFQKILYERDLLLQVAPGFKHVSFLHEGDGQRTGEAIKAREGIVQSLGELIAAMQNIPIAGHEVLRGDDGLMKQLMENQTALPMMIHIKKWVDQLDSYEQELDGLLDVVSKVEKED